MNRMNKTETVIFLQAKMKEILEVFENMKYTVNSGVIYFAKEVSQDDLMLLKKKDFAEAVTWFKAIYNTHYKHLNSLYASQSPDRWRVHIDNNNNSLPEIIELNKRLDKLKRALNKRPDIMKKGKLSKLIRDIKKASKKKRVEII